MTSESKSSGGRELAGTNPQSGFSVPVPVPLWVSALLFDIREHAHTACELLTQCKDREGTWTRVDHAVIQLLGLVGMLADRGQALTGSEVFSTPDEWLLPPAVRDAIDQTHSAGSVR